MSPVSAATTSVPRKLGCKTQILGTCESFTSFDDSLPDMGREFTEIRHEIWRYNVAYTFVFHLVTSN